MTTTLVGSVLSGTGTQEGAIMTMEYRVNGGVSDVAGLPEYDPTMMSYVDQQPTVKPMGWSDPERNHRPTWSGEGLGPHDWTYVQVSVDGRTCRVPLALNNLLLWLALCDRDVGRNCGSQR